MSVSRVEREIVDKLITLSLATAYATDVFIGSMPDDPNVVVCVYKLPGQSPQKQFGSKTLLWENPSVQIVFRGVAYDYDTPSAKAQTAFEAFAQIETEILTNGSTYSTFYNSIKTGGGPYELKRDTKNRVYIALNLALSKDLSL